MNGENHTRSNPIEPDEVLFYEEWAGSAQRMDSGELIEELCRPFSFLSPKAFRCRHVIRKYPNRYVDHGGS